VSGAWQDLVVDDPVPQRDADDADEVALARGGDLVRRDLEGRRSTRHPEVASSSAW
jgi:hypothetical protein